MINELRRLAVSLPAITHPYPRPAVACVALEQDAAGELRWRTLALNNPTQCIRAVCERAALCVTGDLVVNSASVRPEAYIKQWRPVLDTPVPVSEFNAHPVLHAEFTFKKAGETPYEADRLAEMLLLLPHAVYEGGIAVRFPIDDAKYVCLLTDVPRSLLLDQAQDPLRFRNSTIDQVVRPTTVAKQTSLL